MTTSDSRSTTPGSQPVTTAGPPAGFPPSGMRSRARARWAAWRRPRRLDVAAGVALGQGVTWALGPQARVSLGAGCAIGAMTRIEVHAGEVTIGPHVVLGERCVIQIRSTATIGARSRLADEVVLQDHRPVLDDVERPTREQGVTAQPISIGADVRIGARAVVCAGAVIPDGSQVGAQAVVDPVLQREVQAQSVVDAGHQRS